MAAACTKANSSSSLGAVGHCFVEESVDLKKVFEAKHEGTNLNFSNIGLTGISMDMPLRP